jgi:hypothetical protein
MATKSQVAKRLDDADADLVRIRLEAIKLQAKATSLRTELAGLDTKYAEAFAAIDGYAGGTNDEDFYKAKKAAQIAEGTSLHTNLSAAVGDLEAADFTT